MHMDVLPEGISVYHLCAWCPWRPEEGIRCPVTGVPDGFEPMEVLGIDPWSSGRATSVLNH